MSRTPMRSEPARAEPARVAPQFRAVAIPAAIALGAIGGIAAERVNLPWIVGAAGGALAAGLTVLALPSLPTRRATVVLLGIGGLGALRHASFAGADRSWLLVVWAAATMVTLVLVDRADAETTHELRGASPLPTRGREAFRVSAIVSLVVIIAAVALVPSLTDRLGRHVWPGSDPSYGDFSDAPQSLKSANSLDITTRPRLSDAVVFTVDAPRSERWRGETFDIYNGSGWSRSRGDDERGRPPLQHVGSDVPVAPVPFDIGAVNGEEFRQTFHMEAGFSDVLFAAPSARVVETDKFLKERPDGTLYVANSGFGKGAVYTVTSRRTPATEKLLRAADAQVVPDAIRKQYAQAPETTRKVRDLGLQITAGAATNYDKVLAIEDWLGANTKYSLNAPVAPPGTSDVVDDFLFRAKLGWCEQIASSLVVLARSAGIPARLVTGFAPGSRDALTGRFVVRENDAHAWAEIYFPGIGWQSFDPTAHVPLAGDNSGGQSWLQSARTHAVAIGIVLALIALLIGVWPSLQNVYRRRQARRASWSAITLHRLERAGKKAGRIRAPSETPREYAHALAVRLEDQRLDRVGDAIDAEAFSAAGASEAARSEAEAVLLSL